MFSYLIFYVFYVYPFIIVPSVFFEFSSATDVSISVDLFRIFEVKWLGGIISLAFFALDATSFTYSFARDFLSSVCTFFREDNLYFL